ncbi:MAG: Tpl protein [Candidatus Cloacimonetes bacterium]|nr:Tpl protein [Candidatus Cloacimonadota bacterium]NLO12122.1 Tpl protein [Candidatus Cloacimonadota bacterium]
MHSFIEVEFRTGRLGYYKNPEGLPIQPEDLIIVEVERGDDIAQVTHLSVNDPEMPPSQQGNRQFVIKRLATEEDIAKMLNLSHEEERATEVFLNIVQRYPFTMKLIETVFQFDGNKLTFFFSAEGRIDFRVFVRELANVFKTRIELHQTTGRDEARRLGGFGLCGNQYCCASFLKRFSQVTIKMAKDQNLASNLSKISGPCGRLLCCLSFEEGFYVEEAKGFPALGTCVMLKDKKMYVVKNDILNDKVHLSDDEQLPTELNLAEFSKLKVVESPDQAPC